MSLLAVDVGNTSIGFGVFSPSLKTFRIDTQNTKKRDFPAELVKALGPSRGKIGAVAVASVVPWVDPVLMRICRTRLPS